MTTVSADRPSGPIAVIGASGRSGTAVSRALVAQGHAVVAIVRDTTRCASDIAFSEIRTADLTDSGTALSRALDGARTIISTAHARHVPAILAASSPEARLICLGSTRKFTRWPDAHGRGVLAGERALMASGRPGIILHPTMIYGAAGEDNVQRLAALLRRLHVAPLPGGGFALVQPIEQGDVTRALLAAVSLHLDGPESLVIAGADAVPYRRFVQMVAGFSGIGRVRIVSVPAPLLMLGARVARLIPGLPRIGPDEIRRLLEDKAFDIGPMQARLGFAPIGLSEGLTRLFGTRHTI